MVVRNSRTDDKANEKGRESKAKAAPESAAAEAREELEKQSATLKRKSGEKTELKKAGAATSKGLTGELGKVMVVDVAAASGQSADVLIDELRSVDVRPDKVLRALRGKSKAELEWISKLYEERTERKLEEDLKRELDGKDQKNAIDLLHGKWSAGTPTAVRQAEVLEKPVGETSPRHESSTFGLTAAQDLSTTVEIIENADGSQTRIYPDKSRVDIDADQRVTATVDANGVKRTFQYQGDELSRIEGHLGIWTRSLVDDEGNQIWTSDTDQDWTGEFSVDSEGNLHFVPRDGQPWIFTRDGRDVKADSPEGRDIQAQTLDVEIVPEPVEFEQIGKPFTAKDADVEALKETEPLAADQQKAAEQIAREMFVMTINPLGGMDLGDVHRALYGKSAAEIRTIDAAFKQVKGHGLEEEFRDALDGTELGQALELLRHKDKDLVPIPEGLDRAALINAAQAIHDRAGGWLDGPRIWMKLASKTPEETKVIAALYKDMYGIELADHLKDELSDREFEHTSKLLPKITEYPDGKPTAKTYDEVHIDDETGDVITTDKDGTRRTITRVDGTQQVETADSFVYKDREGQVTWTLDKGAEPPAGRSFEYDSEGNLILIENTDGSSIRKERTPPVWREYGTDGEATAKTYEKVFVHHENGDLITHDAGTTTVRKPDGTHKVKTADWVVYKDREGQVTRTLDMQSQPPREWSLKYAEKGELVYVKNPDGSSILKEGDPQLWREYGKNGKPTGQAYDEVYFDDKNGDLVTTHRDGAKTVISYQRIASTTSK